MAVHTADVAKTQLKKLNSNNTSDQQYLYLPNLSSTCMDTILHQIFNIWEIYSLSTPFTLLLFTQHISLPFLYIWFETVCCTILFRITWGFFSPCSVTLDCISNWFFNIAKYCPRTTPVRNPIWQQEPTNSTSGDASEWFRVFSQPILQDKWSQQGWVSSHTQTSSIL